MAYVSIKNAVVKDSFWNGKGMKFVEQFQRKDGTPGETWFTAFFDQPHGLAVGTRFSEIGGVLSVKGRIHDPEDGEARALVDVVLNSPSYKLAESSPDSGFPSREELDDDSPF